MAGNGPMSINWTYCRPVDIIPLNPAVFTQVFTIFAPDYGERLLSVHERQY